jgi:hypothetical protein
MLPFVGGMMWAKEKGMRLHNQSLKITAVWVCLTLLLSGVALAAEPQCGGIRRVAYGNRISNVDFHTAPDYAMMGVALTISCGLVNITPDGQFVGDAAASWNLSSDGLI